MADETQLHPPPGLPTVHDPSEKEGEQGWGPAESAEAAQDEIDAGGRKRGESGRGGAATEVLEPPPKFPKLVKPIQGCSAISASRT